MAYKTLWNVHARNEQNRLVTFRISADGWTEEKIIKALKEVHPELEDISLENLIEKEEEDLKEAC